jgi:hypothetical protein
LFFQAAHSEHGATCSAIQEKHASFTAVPAGKQVDLTGVAAKAFRLRPSIQKSCKRAKCLKKNKK